MPVSAPATFEGLFRRAGKRIRARRALRTVFTGLAIGFSCGAAAAFGLWLLGDAQRAPLVGGALGVLGAVLGAVAAARARWSDAEVALFLDARLSARETITSAIALAKEGSERASVVRSRAAAVLATAESRAVLPRLLAPVHGVSLLGLGLVGVFSLVPSPRTPTPETKPKGAELVKKANVSGLERIEALEKAEGLSEADAERLKKLARDAKQLGSDLARGMPKREALARVGRLRDDIAKERERFSDGRERAGLEAAVNALSAEERTRRAGKALEEGDVVGFDEEMQRLANQAEADARAKARAALDRAREAARSKRSQRLAEMLERQQKLWDEREDAARALRELARLMEKELGADGREALQELDRQGDPRAAARLAETLADVLSELDEAERKRLVERLAKRLAENGASGSFDPERLAELGKRLSEADGRDALREALRDLARNPSADAERERALGDAERGGAEAERGLVPVPLPGPGQPRQGSGSSSQGKQPPGSPGSEPGHGGGDEKHEPAREQARPMDHVEEFRSKAEAKLLPGAPLGTRALGRAPSRPGETADQVGTGVLGSVAAQEVSAVENSDVPEEYREHVGRYFQP